MMVIFMNTKPQYQTARIYYRDHDHVDAYVNGLSNSHNEMYIDDGNGGFEKIWGKYIPTIVKDFQLIRTHRQYSDRCPVGFNFADQNFFSIYIPAGQFHNVYPNAGKFKHLYYYENYRVLKKNGRVALLSPYDNYNQAPLICTPNGHDWYEFEKDGPQGLSLNYDLYDDSCQYNIYAPSGNQFKIRTLKVNIDFLDDLYTITCDAYVDNTYTARSGSTVTRITDIRYDNKRVANSGVVIDHMSSTQGQVHYHTYIIYGVHGERVDALSFAVSSDDIFPGTSGTQYYQTNNYWIAIFNRTHSGSTAYPYVYDSYIYYSAKGSGVWHLLKTTQYGAMHVAGSYGSHIALYSGTGSYDDTAENAYYITTNFSSLTKIRSDHQKWEFLVTNYNSTEPHMFDLSEFRNHGYDFWNSPASLWANNLSLKFVDSDSNIPLIILPINIEGEGTTVYMSKYVLVINALTLQGYGIRYNGYFDGLY